MARRVSILVVDEGESLRLVLILALKKLGWEVTAFACGSEVVRHCAAAKFDVAVVDTDLPDIDGFTLGAWLRAGDRGKKLPVIFMTARCEAEVSGRAAAAGGEKLLLKPFQLEALLGAIRESLSAQTPVDLSILAWQSDKPELAGRTSGDF